MKRTSKRRKIGKFKMGDLFPAARRDRVALVRFVIASRALVAVAKLNKLVADTDSENSSEELVYLMLFGFGTAHEAARAFRHADNQGCFKGLRRDRVPEIPEDILESLDRLRAGSSLDDSSSLATALKFCRDKASFHWDRVEISKTLADVCEHEVDAYIDTKDHTFLSSSIPMAAGLAHEVIRRQVGGTEALGRLVQRIAQFQGDLFRVGEAVYALLLVEEGALTQTDLESVR